MKTTKKQTKIFMLSALLFSLSVGFVLGVVYIVGLHPEQDKQEVYALEKSTQTVTNTVPGSFRDVADAVVPVVVQINVVDIQKETVPDMSGWPWNYLFPNNNNNQQQERERKVEGLGSGVIVRRDGKKVYVLTNNHVVGEADQIEVVLYDKRTYTAKLTGTGSRQDLALIEFETDDRDIPIAELGDSDSLEVGDWVLAVGNPLGYFSSVTAGIVSAKGRSGPSDNINEFIQTDAAINQGNSGGALVDLQGRIVGINTWIATTTGTNIGLGFSIPINAAKKAIDDLISNGKISYGYLGVYHSEIDEDYKANLGVSEKDGNMIYEVIEGSPAEKGGLLPGDFVTAVNGKKIEDTDDFGRLIGELSPGEKARMEIIRDGKKVVEEIKLGVRPDDDEETNEKIGVFPGFMVFPLTDDIRSSFMIDKTYDGVIVDGISNYHTSKFLVAGIQRGDLITEINGTPIKDVQTFYSVINNTANKRFEIKIVRQNNEFTIHINR